MLRRVLYSSKATAGLGMRDALDIIRVSYNRNSQAGLTGGLLFLDGYFYQVLEGVGGAVETCLSRISRDPRHAEIVTRRDERVSEPLFADDWMALRGIDDIDPEVLSAHGYELGLPVERFSADQTLAFLLACFDKQLEEEGAKALATARG